MKKLVLAAIGLCFSVGVNAACDTKSLKGGYEIITQQENACSVITGLLFDGKGVATGTFMQNCKGTLGNATALLGSYSVSQSVACTVVVNASDTLNNQYTLNLYLEPLLKNGFVSVINPQNYNAASFGQILKTK